MCEVCQTYKGVQLNSEIQVNYDPTRTTTLRNAFARDMHRRFNELSQVIRTAIVDEDVFGLQRANRITVQQMNSPGHLAFDFPLTAQKVEAFMEWLRIQVDRGILEIQNMGTLSGGRTGTPWMNMYITDSYKRGVTRARYELTKAGFNIPTLQQTGGIEVSMMGLTHVDTLALLYTRVFTGLKNITDAMDAQISQILAQGLADGDNPRVLARKLVAVINGQGIGELGITDSLGRFIPARRRAEMLARTEIVRAHHQATIQEYRNWGVLGVQVKAEFITAQDNRVCAECEGLEGNVYTLDEAWNIIPVHPSCRCMMLPIKT